MKCKNLRFSTTELPKSTSNFHFKTVRNSTAVILKSQTLLNQQPPINRREHTANECTKLFFSYKMSGIVVFWLLNTTFMYEIKKIHNPVAGKKNFFSFNTQYVVKLFFSFVSRFFFYCFKIQILCKII